METDKLDAVRNRLKMEDELETKKRLKEKEEVIYSNKTHMKIAMDIIDL